MKIILISGKAQHGKDTSAAILKEKLEDGGYKVVVAHYADLLKYICGKFFAWNGKKDDYGRHLLQYVGTDVIRKKSPNYWVDFLSEFFSIFSDEWDYAIIPDTRFPNEVDTMREKGFDTIHIRVKRENFESPLTPEQQMHPSEIALDDVTPDFWFVNNGSIEDLEKVIIHWVKENVNE